MAQINPLFPESGDRPWDATLNLALEEMVNQANANDLAVNGRLSDTALKALRMQTEWNALDAGILPASLSGSQQTALSSVMAQLSALGGGTLRIPRGMEVQITNAINGADNVTLRLEPGSMIRNTNAATSFMFDIIGVRNFEVSGGGTLDYGPRNLPGTTPQTTAIKTMRITDCENVHIRGLIFRNLWARVIDVRGTTAGTNGMVGCRRIFIEDNYFDVVADTGIEARDNANNAPTIGLYIRNNVFAGMRKIAEKNPDGTEPTWSIIYVSRTQKLHISGNDFQSSADTAIMLGSGTNNFAVYDNDIRTTQVGIYCGAVKTGRIFGNDIQSDNDMGIHYYYTGGDISDGVLSITGNTIHDCAKPAIMIEGGNNVVITGNNIDSCAYRAPDFPDQYKAIISIQAANNNPPDSITITGNLLSRGSVVAPTYYGISVMGPGTVGNLVVVGNNVVGTGYTNRFRYASYENGQNWTVQRDTASDLMNKRLVPVSYDALNSQVPLRGAFASHPTHAVIYGDGTNWRRISDGTIVTP